MKKIYYDSEFTQLHRNSTLISVGFISEAGNYFYAEFNDYDKTQINDWLHDQVINNLLHSPTDYENLSYITKTLAPNQNQNVKCYNIEIVDNSENIKSELINWLKIESTDAGQVQIYTDCYAYDWMLLVDLLSDDELSTAMGMPEFINYIPIDLSTALWSRGIDPDISREEFGEISTDSDDIDLSYPITTRKHNSLFDALVAKKCFEKIDQLRGVSI